MKMRTEKPVRVTCITPFDSFPCRSIGRQVRDARDFGVYPEFVVGETAQDTDPAEKGIIDPLCDPRMDRMELLTTLRKRHNPNGVSVAPEHSPAPSPEPSPAPSPEPSPSPTSSVE